MRPKFRAWDKFDKVMRDVTLLDYNHNFVGYSYPVFMKSTMHMELMQSTGLHDKNGQEIFEGDIVKTTRFVGRADEVGGFYEYDKEFIGIVKQLEGSWVIDTGSDAVCLWTEIEENEIIGNIYENKEFGGRK